MKNLCSKDVTDMVGQIPLAMMSKSRKRSNHHIID